VEEMSFEARVEERMSSGKRQWWEWNDELGCAKSCECEWQIDWD